MQVLYLTIKLYAPWVQSLKEKRMIVKSLTARIKNRFNVSVCEAGEQDTHKTILLAVAALCADSRQADSMAGQVVGFTEQSTDAQVMEIEREMR